MKLRSACKGDLDALIALWQDVFGDDERFIRAFYEASGLDRTVIAQIDGRLVGMINCPAIELWTADTRYRGIYIYALAVDRGYRSRGIASALLKSAESGICLPAPPQFSLLIPASESLFDFYAAKGYDRAAYAPKPSEPNAAEEALSPLALDSDALYARYLTACESEAASSAVFVKPKALFALSMGGTQCYAAADGYIALNKAGALIEARPTAPDLTRKKALWKATGDISADISPIISRFMED